MPANTRSRIVVTAKHELRLISESALRFSLQGVAAWSRGHVLVTGVLHVAIRVMNTLRRQLLFGQSGF